MKICLVHEEYPTETNFGGIATYQKSVATQLAKMGHKVTVICRGLQKSYNYTEEGVKIYRIHSEETSNQTNNYINYRMKVCEKLIKLQEKGDIDIIEVPDWGAETVFFEKYRKVPLVVRLHTPLKVWLKYNKNHFGKIKRQMLKWEKTMIKKANYISCCSEILKNLVAKKFYINKEKIHVSPNPANISNFYYDNSIKKNNTLLYVGSIEERKGVLTLAKALNIVFSSDNKITAIFIGKDTTRNNKNISTINYIKNLIKKRYHGRILFLGQLDNILLNKYMNQASVCVLPSLFDNFPYTCLETMSTGTPIIASKFSGMAEMLNDNDSMFSTNNYRNLAKKILWSLSNRTICEQNIYRVHKFYKSEIVCNNLINTYQNIINNYNKELTKEDFQNILINALNEENIKVLHFKKFNNGIANNVFKVITSDEIFVVKQYLHDYDFNLINNLYEIYESNKIKTIRPVNSNIITYKKMKYNVFKYVKSKSLNSLDNSFLKKLSIVNRKTNLNTFRNIFTLCDNYYNAINNTRELKEYKNDILFTISNYKTLKNFKDFKEQKYINHGDLSPSNILHTKRNSYIIDFDESLIGPRLYDYAVMTIKFFTKHCKFKIKKIQEFTQLININNQKNKQEFINNIKLYLCKIVLEKFYLHQKGLINLKNKRQQKDNYKTYLKLLSLSNSLLEKL